MRNRISSSRNAITVAHVIAMTNSYMLPHGTRGSASPRVTMPRIWVTSPITVRASAARTHGPAGAPPVRHRRAAATGGPASAAVGAEVIPAGFVVPVEAPETGTPDPA